MDAIPFDYAPRAPLILVEARVGEGRERAAVVIDTGATPAFPVFLSQAFADRLKLAQSAPITPPDTTAVGPGVQTYRTASLTRFELGPVKLAPAPVAVLPMIDQMGPGVGRRIDAIVGQQFLARHAFTIDYKARRLDLDADPGAEAAAVHFALADKKPLILVTATIAGAGLFTFEIDTGATGTVVSPDAAARAGLAVHGQGVQQGAGGSVQVGVTTAKVAFAGLAKGLPQVAVSEAMTGIAAAAGAPIDGILGTDFFAGGKLTIDYASRRLWFTPP